MIGGIYWFFYFLNWFEYWVFFLRLDWIPGDWVNDEINFPIQTSFSFTKVNYISGDIVAEVSLFVWEFRVPISVGQSESYLLLYKGFL